MTHAYAFAGGAAIFNFFVIAVAVVAFLVG
jgi:hypothetical protein